MPDVNITLMYYRMIKQLQQNKIQTQQNTPETIWQRCVLSMLTAQNSMQVLSDEGLGSFKWHRFIRMPIQIKAGTILTVPAAALQLGQHYNSHQGLHRVEYLHSQLQQKQLMIPSNKTGIS